MQVSIDQQFLPLVKAVERATGFRPHLTTVLRWCTHGARGRKLRSAMLGGRRMTTIAAVREFMQEPVIEPQPPLIQDANLRTKAIEKAKADLDRMCAKRQNARRQ